MDPITLAAIVSQTILGDSGQKILELAIKYAASRLTQAREEYRSRPQDQLVEHFEDQRSTYLDMLSQVQTKAILNLSNQALLQRALAITLDLTVEAYEAETEHQLDSIRRRTGQIESFLERDERERNYRTSIRVVAVVVAVLAFLGLFIFAIVSPRLGIADTYRIPLVQIPLPVIMWSAMGSFASLLYRFNTSGDAELRDPLRWLITRPLIGIIIGAITFVVIQVGFLSIAQESTVRGIEQNGLIWLFAFITGFSDRFAESLLKTLVGRLGGDKDSSLVTTTSPPIDLNLMELLQASAQSVKRHIQDTVLPKPETAKETDSKSQSQNDSETSQNQDDKKVKDNVLQASNSNPSEPNTDHPTPHADNMPPRRKKRSPSARN